MYKEERKFNVNWFDVITKVLFLVAFVLILMFFFPRTNNSNANQNNNSNGKNDTSSKYNFDVLFDRIFGENLTEMKNAARNYFTTDRMPTEIGGSITLTLQEMLDKNMVLPIIDKNGETCDNNRSYVTVTKNGAQDYSLKVNLVCGNEQKHIIDSIGCYDFCTDNTCKKETKPSYVEQFVNKAKVTIQPKPIVNTTCKCPVGYSKQGNKCVRTVLAKKKPAEAKYDKDKTHVEDAIKNDGEEHKIYTDPVKKPGEVTKGCPEGYIKDGDKCIKKTTVPATETTTYTCPEGYIKDGDECKKTTPADKNVKPGKCPSGYEDKNGKCVRTINATKKVTYNKCPSGYKPSGNNCKKTINAAKKTSYKNCPSGYKPSGNKCYKYTYRNKSSKSVKSGGYYKVVGYTYTSWKCVEKKYKNAPGYTNGNTYRVIPLGYRNGYYHAKTCSRSSIPKRQWVNTYKTVKYCPSGTPVGNLCRFTTTKTRGTVTTYSCKSPYKKSGTKCIYTKPKTKKTNYTCPTGYIKNGTKCTITKPKSDETSYSCPPGAGELVGKTCVITKPGIPDTSYSCPTGYEQSDDGKSCTKTDVVPVSETQEPDKYTCPEGYTEEGSGESLKCYRVIKDDDEYYCEDPEAVMKGKKCYTYEKGAFNGYKCPLGYTLKGKYCYKYKKEYAKMICKTIKKKQKAKTITKTTTKKSSSKGSSCNGYWDGTRCYSK